MARGMLKELTRGVAFTDLHRGLAAAALGRRVLYSSENARAFKSTIAIRNSLVYFSPLLSASQASVDRGSISLKVTSFSASGREDAFRRRTILQSISTYSGLERST